MYFGFSKYDHVAHTFIHVPNHCIKFHNMNIVVFIDCLLTGSYIFQDCFNDTSPNIFKASVNMNRIG